MAIERFKKKSSGVEQEIQEKKVEAQKEAPAVSIPEKQEKPTEDVFVKPSLASVKPVAVKQPAKDPVLLKVEGILEQDLEEVYASLPDDIKPKFRIKGEETARKITELVRKARFKVRKIIKLIKVWLKVIPSVNKFFLEQEVARKTQKIMELEKDNKE